MNIQTCAILAFAAAIVGGACNQSPEPRLDDDTAAVTLPTGTSGQPTGASDRSAVSEQREDAGADLPDTASPLALAGVIGIASLAGAAVVRRLRRE